MTETTNEPAGQLHPDYSDPDATPPPWSVIDGVLRDAGIYWLTTTRPTGRPHTTPVIAVWDGRSVWFCTGPDERKARNLGDRGPCTVTTGCNDYEAGTDVVVEGDAERVREPAELARFADALHAGYGDDWRFDTVADGVEHPAGGVAAVYRVRADVVFAFTRGPAAQVRYRP
ncbi:pyridoxamine 5'-phosphate oxidase family protein [Rhodococcus rhodnii]|uniref:Pyridoxamine 5'-phosphate oxidase N-terminal domain-containing protein n=2 Tax=Rhodococcus rhodnii TaxID=38312 RepID=R7WKY9_9NOCA|nr:pyridoxamine 5'-phosphate oxidase family protein [Rhodococcus rhodnii]EOM75950.1 hypothetical protein Rrhod_2704 [Rhodococcus rhodnii LMG 5362]TXG90136.1 pyridoxamine 5'-phosphate oxidase family protein [Rhodococcus rhodnii]